MDSGRSLAIDKRLSSPSIVPEGGHTLEISVIFTSVALTLHALKSAAALASRLSASIRVIVPQLVPYPIPLTTPPVLLEFSERRFRTLIEASKVDARVQIYLCRDAEQTLCAVLAPRSVVVLGGHKTIWPTAEKRLARRLRRAGHEVIVAEKE